MIIEPGVTWPKNLKFGSRDYDAVYAAGPISGSRYVEWFHEPNPLAPEISGKDLALKKSRYTMVASNKLSFISGELYSLRRLVALEASDEVDLFGYSWSRNWLGNLRIIAGELQLTLAAGIAPKFSGLRHFGKRPTSYKGESADKLEPYAANRFAIVIENSLELRTEKLYDAVEAGAIPIYVGPEVKRDVPPGLFIHSLPTLSSLLEGMKLARSIDLDEWSTQRREWMTSPSYLKTSAQRFNEFMDTMRSDLGL